MQLPGWGDSNAVKDPDRQTSSEGLVFPHNRGFPTGLTSSRLQSEASLSSHTLPMVGSQS